MEVHSEPEMTLLLWTTKTSRDTTTSGAYIAFWPCGVNSQVHKSFSMAFLLSVTFSLGPFCPARQREVDFSLSFIARHSSEEEGKEGGKVR